MANPRSISAVGERLGVLDHAPGVDLELVGQRFAERHRLGCDHMHERPALGPRKDRLVDRLGVLGDAEDEAGSRATQCLVRRTGDDLRVRHRRRMYAAGDETREVRHVHQEDGPDLVGDGPEDGEVDDARVRAPPRDDEPGPLGAGLLPDHVVVDPAGRRIHPVVDRLPDCPL